MSFTAEVLTIGQNLDLRTGKQMNYLMLRLPDGSKHQAFVSEETAQALIDAFIWKGGQPNTSVVEVPPPVPALTPSEEEDVRYFGGDSEPGHAPEAVFYSPPVADRDEDGVAQA